MSVSMSRAVGLRAQAASQSAQMASSRPSVARSAHPKPAHRTGLTTLRNERTRTVHAFRCTASSSSSGSQPTEVAHVASRSKVDDVTEPAPTPVQPGNGSFLRTIGLLAAAGVAMTTLPAQAASAVVAADAAWILTSSALVLFMTAPGLAAFYGGLCKRKNILSVLMQCFCITCIQTILWFVVGYSMSFSDVGMAEGTRGLASFVGGFDKMFLKGITLEAVNGTIPEALWCMFQMTFAIITPALMVGSVVERMKFNAVMLYTTLWSVFVYFPWCHMIWGGSGALLADMGVLDFAGGIVVHVTAGIGALVAAIVCGPRKDNQMASGNLTLTMLGTGMLWVGWFGFNGGSAVAAGAEAAFAILATQISAATAAITWLLLDVRETGKASLVGILTGAVAGLATITPCAGFVGPVGACLAGATGSAICRWFSTDLKMKMGYDDSLDVFGVHGVGGFVGTCLLGVLAMPALGGFGTDLSVMQQTLVQCCAAVACVGYTAVVSWVLLKITEAMCEGNLRIPDHVEESEGLDQWCHGENCLVFADPGEDQQKKAI